MLLDILDTQTVGHQEREREREIGAERVKEKREGCEVEEEGLGWPSLGCL